MRTTRIALMMSSALGLSTALPAVAQQTNVPVDVPAQPAADQVNSASPQAASTVQNEDIIVTAQKREQTLIDIPQAVSVISGTTLETQQAQTFQDYLKLVPGLQLTQAEPGSARLIVRGLNTGGVASTVAVYVDETPFGSSSGQANGAVLAGDFDTFDVSRIEVLRGPQGTLYGASSLGGVLRFVTNAPETGQFSARARGGVETTRGGDESYFGNAVVNIPLGDTLAIRGSGTYRKTGGFIDSIGTGGSRNRENIDSSKVYGGRASLLFKPIDNLSVRLSAVLQDINANASTVEESDPATLKTLYGGPTQSIFVSPFRKTRYRVYNGTINYGLGFADILSSTSYSTLKQGRRDDITFVLGGALSAALATPLELYLAQDTNLKKFTQEVRLASSGGGALDYIVGGYYTHEKGLIFQQYVPVTPGTTTTITALPLLASVNLPSTYEEIAGFANVTLHLGERFDIDAGGRYSHNKQRATQTLSGLLLGGDSSFEQPSSENVFTYSVAPKIKFGRDASLYGRVSKGFRPGGPNAQGPGAPASTRSYQSDSTINYEIGFKAQTADRTFGIEIAAFHIDWSRIQLLTTITTDAGPFSFNGNGGKAKSDGVEFAATVRPTPGFDVSLNGAITNARLTQDTASGGFKGDKLPFTPRYSFAVNGDYTWTLTGATKAFVGGSLRFLSKQPGPFDTTYLATFNRSTPRIPSYEVVDLRAGLDFGRFSVEAYVRNLNDADGKLSEGTIGFYPNLAVPTGVIRPRSVGLSLTAAY